MNQDVKRLLSSMKSDKTLEAFCVAYVRIVDHPPSDDNPVLFQKFVPEFLMAAREEGWKLETAYPEVDGFSEALTGRTSFVFRRIRGD